MPTRRENLISNIQTLLQQLSLLLINYNSHSQDILNDFFTTLDRIEDSRIFEKKLKQFDIKYRYTNEYYDLPFLWFACDFFNLIYKQIILGSETHHLIHKILRETYYLLKKEVPLSRISEWEGLQYICQKSLVPILHEKFRDEAQILIQLNSLVQEFSLGSLNPRRINNTVGSLIHGPPWKPKKQIQIQSFFDLSEIVWDLHFLPSAFMLSRIFVQLKINDSEKFKEFFEVLSKPEAQVSQASRTYITTKRSKELFIGTILIPQGLYDHFLSFLQMGEEQGVLDIVECQEIADFKHSVSYALYEAGIGWSFQTQRFKKIVRKKDPLKHIEPAFIDTLYATGQWNPNWSCLNSPKTTDFIEFICKYWGPLSYNDLCQLAGHIKLNQDKTKLFEPYNKILRELLDKKVMQVMITPKGLLRGYSIDYYLIVPPRTVSKEDLKIFFSILPYSLSFELNNGHVRIFSYLDSNLTDFINHNLKWRTMSVRMSTAQSKLDIRFFNFDSWSWKRPGFLKERELGKLNF